MKKIARLRAGNSPRVLDLFAGCGGLSLGFHSASFQIVGAVESDAIAILTHAMSFHGASQADEDKLARHATPRDITTLEPSTLSEELALGPVEDAVDVMIGGPPCQAYARVGRAKLREIAEHPRAFLKDPRSNLYLRFLAYVRAFDPVAIVMENVPDALNFGGHNVAEETCEVLEEMGYSARYTLLNSANYGVPQMRERMFLIAYAREIGVSPAFPTPTHWVTLPRGYHGSRQVALRHVAPTLFADESFYVSAPAATPDLPSAVSAQAALEDLPPITKHLHGELKRGTRRFNEMAAYRKDIEPNAYARLMRSWPGFENLDGVLDHVIRSLPRDYAIFRVMRPGDEYPAAFAIANKLFEQRLKQLRRRGRAIREGTAEFRRLRASIVPPYDDRKFPNKWRKMEPDLPARTLMAHLGKDGYSHIHYDSAQARTISVREAARLQSFPDGFTFCGTMNPAFRQIGNAVPPLMARAIATSVSLALRGNKANEQTGVETTDGVRSDVFRMALSEP